MQVHRVATETIEQLLAGPIDLSAMMEIQAGQHSRRLLLLKAVHDLTKKTPGIVGQDDDDVWSILVAAERCRPDILREILLYPTVGMWLVRTVRQDRGIIADNVPQSKHLSHLGSIAATAAIRTGTPAIVTVPVWNDEVALPMIGRFRFAAEGSSPFVQLRNTPSGVDLRSGLDAPWLPATEILESPVRRHRSIAKSMPIRWTIDDLDPYRESGAVEPPTRIDDDEFARWCQLLDEAWEILIDKHPDYAVELTSANPVLIPLAESRGIVASSSSAAFGAIMLASPESAVTLAETLVHELQHSKLNAMLDLVSLRRDGAQRLRHAPWRRDPRPTSGLLHGIYAFTSVIEFWRAQRRSTAGQGRQAADFTFAYYRKQVQQAVRSVDGDPELTDLGARFVAATAERLSACVAEEVPDEVLAQVETTVVAQRIAWRLRNMAPEPGDVDTLTQQWLTSQPAPGEVLDNSTLSPNHRTSEQSDLGDLLKLKALEPQRFADLDTQSESSRSFADFAFATGDYDTAILAYSEHIRVDPDDDSAWVGLLLSLRANGVTGDLPPEVVAATYRRITEITGAAPEPVALVSWLTSRTGRARPG